MSYYYEKHNVLLAQTGNWSKKYYGFNHECKGDCIFRTCLYAMSISEDNPTKAFTLLQNCSYLLQDGIRWPDELNHPLDKRYRSQYSVTRDPIVMFIVACFLTDNTELLKYLRIPIFLYRPYLKNLLMFTTTLDIKYKRRIERQLIRTIRFAVFTEPLRIYVDKYRILKFLKHKVGLHSYSLHLFSWINYVINSDKLKAEIMTHIPIWNDLLWALMGGALYSDTPYTSRERYQWTEDNELETEPIPIKEPIKLDLDILNYIKNQL